MTSSERSPNRFGPAVVSVDGGTVVVRALAVTKALSVIILSVRFAPLFLFAVAPLVLWVPFLEKGPSVLALTMLVILVPPAIALTRPEELTIDDDGFTLRPLIGRAASFRWSETYAIQVAGWWPSRRYLFYRLGIGMVLLATPPLLGAPLWVGIPLAAIWIAVPFAASDLTFSVAPHGTRFADPGPNVAIRKQLTAVLGLRVQERVASLLLEAAEAHSVPAWSTWDERRRNHPWY